MLPEEGFSLCGNQRTTKRESTFAPLVLIDRKAKLIVNKSWT